MAKSWLRELYANPRYILAMAVFNKSRKSSEHFELRYGRANRGRLAVTMDLVTATPWSLVGQTRCVYCQSQRCRVSPVMMCSSL